jgi:hypothetical protein
MISSHPLRDALEFPARAFDLRLRLLLLFARHLRHGFGQAPAGPAQNRRSRFQFTLQRGSLGGGRRRRLPPRLQKQLRLCKDAFADHVRAVAPGGIKLRGLPRVAMMPGEGRGHPLAVFRAHARYWHQILHRCLRRDLPFAYLLLDRFRQ